MSDQNHTWTRREFNLATFSAGLATLTSPAWVWAQEDQTPQKLSPSGKRKTKTPMTPQQQESAPAPRHINYSHLQLFVQVEAFKTHLDLALYLSNTSDRPVDVPHTSGGIPHTIPTGVIVVSGQKFALDPRIPEEDLARITRAASVDYLKIPPSDESGTRTFFALYRSTWPEQFLQDARQYMGELAKVDLALKFDHAGPMPRTMKRVDELLAVSERFTLPVSFEEKG